MDDKQLKQEFKKRLDKEYKDFFPCDKLERIGFKRQKCGCGRSFWSTIAREKCGDPDCIGSYGFIGKQREDIGFVEVWTRFEKHMRSRGYESITRYPSIARWNPSMHFTLASIADFQPYVVSGETPAPAEKLVVPQTCIRFNDIDNVGITGSHNTGFTMIGQHAFLPAEKFDQAQVFQDYLEWFTKGMKMKPEELVIHEDAWAGGGNFGPCLEFFSQGVELGNQVYMMYEDTEEGPVLLKQRVLDMGMGQERCAWFLSGKPTIYDATMPTVVEYLKKKTGIKPDNQLLAKWVPYGGMLNADEVDDVEQAWKSIANRMGVSVDELKQCVLPMSGIYSIADHTRALLYTLADGALPGNVGGGYNLRTLYRRMRMFMERYDWDIDLKKALELHAQHLKKQYPELLKSLDLVKKIIDVEERKYLATREKNKAFIEKEVLRRSESELQSMLIDLYDSQGIMPESVRQEAAKHGKNVKVPENFYALLSEKHEGKEQELSTKKTARLKLDDVSETTILYFDKWDLVDFNAFVVSVEENHVILNQTAFYPTSGGQANDEGSIDGSKVIDVFKQGNVIVHTLEKRPGFKQGDKVKCHIDFDKRMQLAQHHTAAHIINGAARRVLGDHIWQAGAGKTVEKARLDITHYDTLKEDEINSIEELSNKIVLENRPVHKSFLARNIAEAEYGFRLYQGGAVPGAKLRIVNVEDFDVEACGGTHLDATGDVKLIRIIRSTKIQDGVIRLEFVAGRAAYTHQDKQADVLNQAAQELECEPDQVAARAEELFTKWKQARKAKKKGRMPDEQVFVLESQKRSEGDALQEAVGVLKTQKQYLIKTIQKFKQQIQEMR